ncbi:MAG: hypothetical protein Q8L48_03240 [Archangium sp.]|nr:hypothetical protein [Archangium sp.]
MRLVTLVVAILPVVGLAQEDGGAAFAAPDAGVVLAAPPAAPPDAGPAPGPASVLDTVLAWVRPYALFKPTVIASSSAVESFGQPNASASTAAANPVLAMRPDEGRLTFQIAQSRVGLRLNEKGSLRGQLELDFIDFSKASPTVASLPRLRLAVVEWTPLEQLTLVAGQDWDLHAPLAPHGENLVGARFLSGNAGFIRQQVKALGRFGPFELAAAVGMEGVNATAKDSAFELSGVPTFALRATWLSGKSRVGLSALATSLRFDAGAPTERRTLAGGVSAFADVSFGRTNLRAEVNVGRNMANIGLLTLGFGGAGDVDEWGGFLSVRHGFTDMHFVYANAGLMRVLTPATVRASYGYAALPPDGGLPPMSSAALTGTGPGLLHNAGVNLGYELRVSKNLAFMLEGFFMQSEHKLLDLDAARVSGLRRAFGGEVEACVSF